jgi:hypothetical protein
MNPTCASTARRVFGSSLLLLGLFAFWSCNAQTQSESESAPYPGNLVLNQGPAGFRQQYGFWPLSKASGLKGSLCWCGPTDIKPNGQADAPTRTSILQRVDIGGAKADQIYNFVLPPYARHNIGAITAPVFKGSKDQYFVRATRYTTDVGQYSLYELSSARKSGILREDNLYLIYRFQVSPSGNHYAFEIAEPYSDANYALVSNNMGQRKVISEDPTTRTFSWSSRNTLIYSAFPKNPDYKKNWGYPNVYENDLKGNVKLLKDGGYSPLLSPNGRHIASFVAHVDTETSKNIADNLNFDPYRVNRVGISVFDQETQKEKIFTRIYEEYARLLWAGDSQKLYVVENYYVFSKKTVFCRISVFDVQSQSYTLLCKLEQKGEATSSDDAKLLPYFTPVKIANDKYLLFCVPVNDLAVQNYHLLAVDLMSGKRHDIYSFPSAVSRGNPLSIDWIDSQ